MKQDLIGLRKQVMARADAALDAAWPARTGDEYVREMRWAAGQLEMIAAKMKAKSFDLLEQSRTYQHLGSVYADLEPALGKEMLLEAKKAYQTAESLLEGQVDELERARLNFNFANTLRRIDPNDIRQLQEAKHRLLAARAYFEVHAPQHLSKVDAALQSVETLLRIAPLANAVKQNADDVTALEKQLAAGANVDEIAEKAKGAMSRGGGIAGMLGQLKAIIPALPHDQTQSDKFADVQKQLQGLTEQVLGGSEMMQDKKQILTLLSERLNSEAEKGLVSRDRAEALTGVLERLERIVSADEKDLSGQRRKGDLMHQALEGIFEVLHYPSYGIKCPLEGSRARDLVELNWQLRRYLMAEMNRTDKGEEESREALDLYERATRVDRRIYEAAADDTRAMIIEKEELRPLALAVRNFSARTNTMPATPIWRSANVVTDTNAVFFSGAAKWRPSIAAACRNSGLETLAEPAGQSYASARWKQLQQAAIAVFDLRDMEGPGMCKVTYELGIALSLGRPVVVLVGGGQTTPFDVEIAPVVLSGGSQADAALKAAIDQSKVLTYPMPLSVASRTTLEYVISTYPRPQKNTYVDQTLRMLSDLRETPDPLAITRTLSKFFEYLNDGNTMLIHPWWSPVYPEGNKARLFHVMPFKPQWANEVTVVTRAACEAAGMLYVRDDDVAEPNVIRSIWEEIARATHVVADLTGFSPNVALELGIAHTLGKNVLMMSQGDPKGHLFESISRFRVQSYDTKKLDQTLRKKVSDFLATGGATERAASATGRMK